MPAIRCSRSYSRLSNTALSSALGSTIVGFTTSPLKTPPVLPAALSDLKTNFDSAIVKAAGGGRVNTAAMYALRAEVLVAMDKNASYVDIECNDNETLLLDTGYKAVSTNRAQTVLEAPQVVKVEQGQSGQLRIRIKADRNAKTFVGRLKKVGDTEFGPAISFKNSISILFTGLTAGVTYILQVCAIGGSTGQSDWSAPVEKMVL